MSLFIKYSVCMSFMHNRERGISIDIGGKSLFGRLSNAKEGRDLTFIGNLDYKYLSRYTCFFRYKKGKHKA